MVGYQSSVHKNVVKLENSNQGCVESNNLQGLLNFLLEPQPNQFRVTWDLESFTAPILGKLDMNYLKKLYEKGQVWIKESGHSITYNPRKSLYLTWGSCRAKYYHLSQFFNGDKPKNVAELKDMGEELLKELSKIGIEPSRLSSPVALLDNELDKIDYPNYKELPNEVGQMAWDCCGRAQVEAHQLGHFDMAYDYDIVSSFPSACAELVNLRYGSWAEGAEVPDHAYYGFAKGIVKIDSRLSPIVYANNSGKLFNPVGKWRTILTLQEIQFIEQYKLGNFKIESGWWWIPKIAIRDELEKYMPFRELMNRLYGHRLGSKMLDEKMKKSMIGIYGRLLQTFRDGTLASGFNPVYGAIIETDIRLKVAKFILDNKLENNVIHVSTDGCLLDKQVKISETDKMGSWRLDSSGPALVVSSGCLFYGDKKPNQIYYSEAIKMIASKPEVESWSKVSKRMFTVGDVLENNDLEKIGKTMPIVIGFGLKKQHDRDFGELPDSGISLLNKHYRSQPYRVSKLSKPVESQF